MRWILMTLLGTLLIPTANAFAEEDGEKERWAVVMIGKSEIRVVPADEIEALKDELAEQYDQEVAAHAEAKQAAKEAGEKFKEPRPVKPAFKILARSVDSREKADAIREKNLSKLAGPVFVVVQVGEKYDVIKKEDFIALKKQLAEEFKEGMVAHKADRKGTPKPKKVKARIASKGFKSEDAANLYKEKLTQKRLGQKPRKSSKSKT